MASIEPEAAFEERDDALDSSAEVAQFAEDPGALGHLGDSDSTTLGEDDIIDAELFDFLEILAGREASVEGNLLGSAAMDFSVPLNHVDGEC